MTAIALVASTLLGTPVATGRGSSDPAATASAITSQAASPPTALTRTSILKERAAFDGKDGR